MIDQAALAAVQGPLKEAYKAEPDGAKLTLSATGRIGDGVTCSVETGRAMVKAGLHPLTGGDGLSACSGDMLLEALVACAGVTLGAVATSLGIEVGDARLTAEGDLDFRGTLSVSKEAPVGFSAIRLLVDLDAEVDEEQRALLAKLTERFCVVFQTLSSPPQLSVSFG
jgi:uncharacterized OsmC-like protein